MKVGYLGPKNSFTFQAANELFEENNLVSFASIPLTIEHLENKSIDLAVVPIENSLEGSVHATVDYLFGQTAITVQEEIILPIRQQLLGLEEVKQPQKILSHPQALAQTKQYLKTYYPEVSLEAVSSTTFAAQYVATHPENKLLAIASEKAAREYNLKVVASDIQDNAANQTRFWVLALDKNRQITRNTQDKKVTLFITLPANLPGALHQVLSAFAWRKIDLAKIESRPLKTNLGEYFFVIDVVLKENEILIENAVKEIELLQAKVQRVGTYSINRFT
ncbi:prephenate dehydratase [Tetragenococcus osmophilus]|uniref:Prephenate dehydratase n=1 Tax=Tetragenococcus osmophilus TaxID=526944 RepID=A0AA37XJE7_9ENTE|nr:prephenate dehydratase [Tetragenococcus osmophilus]AYW48594.1 prephenate dehydratase [Tetragenococcus osmophilus]GMA54508.1 prephenate dehydratase [Alicyclobacillus contaminans]GMA71643.1 prephenate dehydratase [Tetragenococcus osmophilus]